MTLKKSKNIFIYVFSIATSAIGIFLNFFLARVLGANNYGQLQYLVALAITCSEFFIFGLNTFLIREAKNNKHNGEVMNKCLTLFFILVLFLFPIVFRVLFEYAFLTINNCILVFGIIAAAVLIGINSLFSAFFQGSGKYQLTIFFESFLPKICLLALAIIFYFLGQMESFKNYYILFYIVIYFVIAAPLLLVYFKRINFSFPLEDLSTILFFFGVTITYSMGNNLTKVLQGSLYKNEVALGIISVSLNIVSIVRVFTSVFNNLIKPIFAKRMREGDTNGLIESYRFNTRLNSYIVIPLYLFFIFHSDKFLHLFGNSYLEFPKILLLISIANMVSDVTGPNGTMLAMTGKEKWELFNGFIYFAIYLLCIFLFSFDKVYGLCYSLLFAQIAVNIAKFIEVGLIFKVLPLDLKTIVSQLLILLINSGIILLVGFVKNIFLWFIVGVLVGMVLIVVNCFVLSLRGKKDFNDFLSLRL